MPKTAEMIEPGSDVGTVKERGFRAYPHEVRAILSGTQTQMRRVVRLPKNDGQGDDRFVFKKDGVTRFIDCPYGQPGDRLWLRETWKPDVDGDVSCITYAADGAKVHIENTQAAACKWLDVSRSVELWPKMEESKWRPSIHMPRWASRITLEITAVRVERLQDISEADAKAEGVEAFVNSDADEVESAMSMFAYLWESINGQGSWDLNPWVWVIEFKRVD